jgi:hypothetical protein
VISINNMVISGGDSVGCACSYNEATEKCRESQLEECNLEDQDRWENNNQVDIQEVTPRMGYETGSEPCSVADFGFC